MGIANTHTDDDRILFVLPRKGKNLVGSTEVIRPLENGIAPTEEEINFLINELQKYVGKKINKSEILSAWSGIRPLIRDNSKPNSIKIKKYLQEFPDKISDKYEFRNTEIVYCIENELAITTSDVLVNRFGIPFFDVCETEKIIPKVSCFMKEYFNWTILEEKRQNEEIYDVLKSFLNLSKITKILTICKVFMY